MPRGGRTRSAFFLPPAPSPAPTTVPPVRPIRVRDPVAARGAVPVDAVRGPDPSAGAVPGARARRVLRRDHFVDPVAV